MHLATIVPALNATFSFSIELIVAIDGLLPGLDLRQVRFEAR